ncbi:hypothetical protein CA13_01460 [Planctomycetes bacterium CA13]|uniref:Uncharacterized protein n=1 Tax=Novipirellula herctigrandis TaxID=2527986 RepID=A0A5C5YUN9_9BACT|nr:hypothetical protein CA13_01460 [Planctomycetes bacterium CA13]
MAIADLLPGAKVLYYEPFWGGHFSENRYVSRAVSRYEKAHNGVKHGTNYQRKEIRIGSNKFEHGIIMRPAGKQGLRSVQ